MVEQLLVLAVETQQVGDGQSLDAHAGEAVHDAVPVQMESEVVARLCAASDNVPGLWSKSNLVGWQIICVVVVIVAVTAAVVVVVG